MGLTTVRRRTLVCRVKRTPQDVHLKLFAIILFRNEATGEDENQRWRENRSC